MIIYCVRSLIAIKQRVVSLLFREHFFFLSRTNIITIAILIIVAVFVSDYVKRLSRTQRAIFFLFLETLFYSLFQNGLWRIVKPTVEIARHRSVS